ncbi:regulatory factor X 1/2/3, partial [Paragonimus westermani]
LSGWCVLVSGGMQSVSGPTATVVQVSPKNHGTTPTIIQQNGQHVLVGKLAGRAATTTTELNTLQSTHSTSVQNIYPAHYIETVAEQTVYATNGENGHVQYQGYAPIIYAPVSGGQTYYQTATGQVLASAFTGSAGAVSAGTGAHATGALGSGHAQLVTHQGATYLVQGGQLEEDASAISHTAKASPVTVQWLVENYETAEGVSLPRSTLYFHYLQHCNEHKLEPMNPASFGKLIRSVFFGLRTRRLGTRGNSKYHYYGIRIKPNSPLNHFVEDAGFSIRHYPNYHRQTMEAAAEWKTFTNSSLGRIKSSSSAGSGVHSHSTQGGLQPLTNAQHTRQTDFTTSSLRTDKSITSSYVSNPTVTNNVQSGTANSDSLASSGPLSSPNLGTSGHQHAQFLGEASSALPNLDEICRSSGLPVPGETDLSNLTNDGGVPNKGKSKVDPSFCADVITFCRLYALSASYMLDAVVNLDFTAIETVWKAFWRTEEVRDSRLKQSLSQERLFNLVSDSAVLQFVRLYDHTFYQSLAEVLIPNVLRPIPHTLTQAIRNFAKSLEEQASWVCQCSDATVSQLEQDFKRILHKHASLEEWAQWLDTVVTGILQPLEGNSLAYTRAAHQLILKWSFYSSMVIRDLTLRSAASFGSFHLIRLLYDEYIFYLVEHKVAAHLGMTPVAVMGEMGRHLTQQHYAQTRLHSDLIGRREFKSLAGSTEEFDPLGFSGPDGLGLREDNYHLSLSDEHRTKPSVVDPSQDEDEEVDEYLDDEDDVDDSTGDESAMLKHAHASVQAYCRSTGASSKPNSDAVAFDSSVVVVDSNHEGSRCNVENIPPLAPVSGASVVDMELPSDPEKSVVMEERELSVLPGQPQEESVSVLKPDSELIESGKPSLGARIIVPESSCSPPPILATPNPVRKVVRVTTFCDPHPPLVDVPTSVACLTVLSTDSDVHTRSSSEQSLTSADKSDMSESSPVKRVKLS